METTIGQVLACLQNWAPLALQETYDNAGLAVGSVEKRCTGVLCALDLTETVVAEAVQLSANLLVVHHPPIFKGLKSLTGKTISERALILAIKNELSVYAIHTNLDNILSGVNHFLANAIGLQIGGRKVLAPLARNLAKLYTYVPTNSAEMVRQALFSAGAGHIGAYEQCSFNTNGLGTFRPLPQANPTIGKAGGSREDLEETKIEVIFPRHLGVNLVSALRQSHPYEEVAYEIISLENEDNETGSGLIGRLPNPTTEGDFLSILKNKLGLPHLRHSGLLGKSVETVAICGGSGSFLVPAAIAAGADFFITADLKYHDFFEANHRLVLADIGHYESECFAIEGICQYLQANFPNFAILKTKINTNPVKYF